MLVSTQGLRLAVASRFGTPDNDAAAKSELQARGFKVFFAGTGALDVRAPTPDDDVWLSSQGIGVEECTGCNGYGSSLNEASDKCSKCGGSGFQKKTA